MIRKLTVSNYRSLGEVTVRFDRFTALVGPNGSGKSNVVDALRFVADAMTMGLSGAITDRGGIDAVRRWSGGHPFNLALRLDLALAGAGETAVYEFELRGDREGDYSVKHEQAVMVLGGEEHSFRVEEGEWRHGPEGLRPKVNPAGLALPTVGGDARFRPLFEALAAMAIYDLYPDTLAHPQKYTPVRPMTRHGDNWVSILRDQAEETWKPELVSALERLAGDIVDVRVTQAASYLVVQFRHNASSSRRKWFEAAQESAGTLRVAGILTALLQQPPLPLVGIEEPELTVHPGVIPLLLDYLRQACRSSQVIITTHSPELLDLLDADEIRVVQRAGEATSVAPLAPHQKEAVRQGLLTLGELMTSEGLQADLSFDRIS